MAEKRSWPIDWRLEQLVVVLLGQRDGDVVVVVLDKLLAEEDERLTWRQGGKKLFDEVVDNDANLSGEWPVGNLPRGNNRTSVDVDVGP